MQCNAREKSAETNNWLGIVVAVSIGMRLISPHTHTYIYTHTFPANRHTHADLYRDADANGDPYCDADHYRDANAHLNPNGHEHADAHLDPHADALACRSGTRLCRTDPGGHRGPSAGLPRRFQQPRQRVE
jgi:hypothetical protein